MEEKPYAVTAPVIKIQSIAILVAHALFALRVVKKRVSQLFGFFNRKYCSNIRQIRTQHPLKKEANLHIALFVFHKFAQANPAYSNVELPRPWEEYLCDPVMKIEYDGAIVKPKLPSNEKIRNFLIFSCMYFKFGQFEE